MSYSLYASTIIDGQKNDAIYFPGCYAPHGRIFTGIIVSDVWSPTASIRTFYVSSPFTRTRNNNLPLCCAQKRSPNEMLNNLKPLAKQITKRLKVAANDPAEVRWLNIDKSGSKSDVCMLWCFTSKCKALHRQQRIVDELLAIHSSE